jgi:hypothetical protein
MAVVRTQVWSVCCVYVVVVVVVVVVAKNAIKKNALAE